MALPVLSLVPQISMVVPWRGLPLAALDASEDFEASVVPGRCWDSPCARKDRPGAGDSAEPVLGKCGGRLTRV